ncbi:MAG TPA: hypothetical protein VNW15_02840 [Rhizomicrobium sp.]|jgi:hypothetical protein|nr:hypothetical protein [Rhizomicrobium sp.]
MAASTGPRRDALGYFCFYLHLAILAFITLGWAVPLRGVLIGYLIFVPGTVLHWKLNAGACVLNNLESWLRYRRWRAPERNQEEGAWLRTLIRSLSGIALTRARMDLIIYGAMALFWALAWHHFLNL